MTIRGFSATNSKRILKTQHNTTELNRTEHHLDDNDDDEDGT